MQFEVDLILFSEMQPSIDTNDTPSGLYTLEYNTEHKRTPGKGIGNAITETSSNLAQSYTFLALPTNRGIGLSTYHTHQ